MISTRSRPRRGLAAGKVHLQDPERSRLPEDARPGRSIELVFAAVERQRIGAIRAAERTAVRELGEETEWSGQGRGSDGDHLAFVQFLYGRACVAVGDSQLLQGRGTPRPYFPVARLTRNLGSRPARTSRERDGLQAERGS